MLERTLLQRDTHRRESRAKAYDDLQQRISGLDMGGRRARRAALLAAVFKARLLPIFRFDQQALNDLQHTLARLGQPGQTLTVALENDDAQFIFKFADLPAHARLRREQRVRYFGQVVAAPRGFADRAQLLKIHLISFTKIETPSLRQINKHVQALGTHDQRLALP
jgi:hypothetical protein